MRSPRAAAAPAAAPAANTAAPRNLFEAAAAAASQPQGAGAGAGAGGAAAGGGSGELAALRNTPIFAQLRTLVQQNPALLQPFLQQLGASNPELLSVSPDLAFLPPLRLWRILRLPGG